ncbi:hypothetical protein [Dyadobacter sp. NIV53]|uniref:hypothetical protein n=1 Tax=Dyadobacter sp. NIV53 TaxID=2861765 RepID=UPI001C8766D9|nr:hypothetical protein [Dyadobacter sp. NIV53]
MENNMCQHSSHNPIQCVVPPYISDKLLDQASARKLPVIVNDELRSSRFRNDRAFLQNSTKHSGQY